MSATVRTMTVKAIAATPDEQAEDDAFRLEIRIRTAEMVLGSEAGRDALIDAIERLLSNETRFPPIDLNRVESLASLGKSVERLEMLESFLRHINDDEREAS